MERVTLVVSILTAIVLIWQNVLFRRSIKQTEVALSLTRDELSQTRSGTRPWLGITGNSDAGGRVKGSIRYGGSTKVTFVDTLKNFGDFPAHGIQITRTQGSDQAEVYRRYTDWKNGGLLDVPKSKDAGFILNPGEMLDISKNLILPRLPDLPASPNFDSILTVYQAIRIGYKDQMDSVHVYVTLRKSVYVVRRGISVPLEFGTIYSYTH